MGYQHYSGQMEGKISQTYGTQTAPALREGTQGMGKADTQSQGSRILPLQEDSPTPAGSNHTATQLEKALLESAKDACSTVQAVVGPETGGSRNPHWMRFRPPAALWR